MVGPTLATAGILVIYSHFFTFCVHFSSTLFHYMLHTCTCKRRYCWANFFSLELLPGRLVCTN